MHRTAWLAVAAVNGLIAVLADVFAALILPGLGVPEVADLVAAGARFQIVHALALMALLVLAWPGERVAWLFLYGTFFFSGSLYLRALGLPPPVLAIAVLGALLALFGWFRLAWKALARPRA